MSPLPPLGFKQFVAASTNSYESISTVTVGSGGSSSISFSSIPSTYKHLQIRAMAKMSSTAASGDDGWIVQCNGDTGTNYAWHMLYGAGSSANAFTPGASQSRMYPYGLAFSGSGNIGWGVMVADALDYANTSKYKTFRYLSGYDSNTLSGDVVFASGMWMNTAAITSISIASPFGNFVEYSSFALYGIKGA